MRGTWLAKAALSNLSGKLEIARKEEMLCDQEIEKVAHLCGLRLALLEVHDIMSAGQVKKKDKVWVASDLDLTC